MMFLPKVLQNGNTHFIMLPEVANLYVAIGKEAVTINENWIKWERKWKKSVVFSNQL